MTASRRVVALSIILLLGGLLNLALHAPGARAAARFTYELCDSELPAGDPPALDFTISSPVAMHPFDTCAEPGGSVGIQDNGHLEAASATMYVGVPPTPGGFVESETITAGTAAFIPANHGSFVVEEGWPGSNVQDSTRTIRIRTEPGPGPESGDFEIYLECDPGFAGGCEAGPIDWAHYIAATEVDPNPPKLSIEGSLLTAGTLRGHQPISAMATDVGGGVSSLEVLVNGTPAYAPTTGACALANVDNPSIVGTVAFSPSPCPPTLQGSWSLDTEDPPFREGANTVSLCAADFATIGEPNRTCSSPQTVNVDNSCTDSPVPGGELLSEQFASSGSETRTVEYGSGAEVTGRLTNDAEDPVSGATLCVKLQTQEVQPEPVTVGSVTTDANGDYSYKLPPGPNRNVIVGFRHDSLQVAHEVRFYSHVSPTLSDSSKKLHNGQRIHFSGQLPGPGRRGRVVILQANVKGSKRWITFRRATSGHEGIFAAGYHFTSTTRKTTYRFRAIVPEQAGYPWLQGHSKPVGVLVRP